MVERLMRSQADSHHPDLGTALNHLLSSGGKRIRPGVVLLTGGMLNGDTQRLVTLSAAIELLHTATLVHDDLIDGAFLRRGMATLNSQWSPAATVLTGDFVFAKAARLAADTENLELMSMFSETLATIVNGEITQLFSSHGVANKENYFQRIYAKTASLFELCTTAAAMISNGQMSLKEERARLWLWHRNGIPDRRRCAGFHRTDIHRRETSSQRLAPGAYHPASTLLPGWPTRRSGNWLNAQRFNTGIDRY